ncbi:hypothetical protein [Glutamicibacter sp. NPDC090743]|uniref:hypothetical protein n=1 Tax=Glutamicibacter sp. NPDC090743 TaxID=3364001 RepID=UPI00382EC96D
MNAVISKENPINGDVLIIASEEKLTSLRMDLKADISLFLNAGISVAIALTAGPRSADASKIQDLIEYGLKVGCRFVGKGDAFLASSTFVYDTPNFLRNGVEVQFSTEQIAYLIEDIDWFRSDSGFGKVLDRSAAIATGSTIFLGSSNDDLKAIQIHAPNHRSALWNFLNSEDSVPITKVVRESKEFWLGSTFDDANRELGVELKKISKKISSSQDTHLVLRAALPSRLENPRDGKEVILGYPFVPLNKEQFIASLDVYILPLSGLKSNDWKSEISYCLNTGIPIYIPELLRPVVEERAHYFDGRITNELIDRILSPEQNSGADNLLEEKYRSSRMNNFRNLCDLLGFPLHSDAAEVLKNDESLPPILFNSTRINEMERKPKKVCFVTSNGAGMGHLTRLLAVARRLDSDVVASFISLSQACGVVSEYGFDFEYLPSKGDLRIEGPEWNKYFNRKFVEALNRARPDVVVFDGTWPYQGISLAVKSYEAEFVWMRRGMWRQEISSTSMVRNPNFSAVVAPGDVAEKYDKGATQRAIDAYEVEPIVVMDESELLTRAEARKELGIGLDANAMLITLGAGNINKIDDDVAEIIQEVRALKVPWEILMTSPLISNSDHHKSDVRSLSIYPLAKYAKAFDFVVSATGYNSYHEWLAYKVPTLWIPNLKTITDDQISRAMFAHDHGLGFAVAPESNMGISEAIKKLADRSIRDMIISKMNEYSFDNGAYKAAKYISTIAKER